MRCETKVSRRCYPDERSPDEAGKGVTGEKEGKG
jgi:hypothetical protein